MALLVQKFGGTSVGSVERIEAVAEQIISSRQQGHQVVVVVSAMAGETNRLIELAQQVDTKPSSRELDVLISTGEQVTAALLSMAIVRRGHSAISLLADQVGIETNNRFGKARIKSVDHARILEEIEQGRVVIIAGFQGRDKEKNITTLGRGGTDTTAVAVAAAIKADECQIYTDVDGVYTTDPRIEPNARRMSRVTFDEMLELASLGAKVLQIRAVEYAGIHKVRLRVLSSFSPDEGTLITYEEEKVDKPLVSGIAFNRDEAILTVTGIRESASLASDILSPIAEQGIEVDMIVQNIQRDGTVDFTFTVHRSDFDETNALLSQLIEKIGAKSVQADNNVAKISVVGVGMKSHSGVAANMFSALAAEGIKTKLISTSEIKISVVVEEKYLELCVRALHSAFGLHENV
ncbi:aspartate kinase [Flocculibacter collagenilyticus]|uniref:aspartate kinase n=1 Tax=Flocculibacter collagenilyticus TaxID=2744479 RepID=UPI0018F34BF8|nr:aspartate kinase [Flocculibacter collagenilyticus]